MEGILKKAREAFNLNSALLTLVLGLLTYIWSGYAGTVDGLVKGQSKNVTDIAVLTVKVDNLAKHCLMRDDLAQWRRGKDISHGATAMQGDGKN